MMYFHILFSLSKLRPFFPPISAPGLCLSDFVRHYLKESGQIYAPSIQAIPAAVRRAIFLKWFPGFS
jgi:hypothetical protein